MARKGIHAKRFDGKLRLLQVRLRSGDYVLLRRDSLRVLVCSRAWQSPHWTISATVQMDPPVLEKR